MKNDSIDKLALELGSIHDLIQTLLIHEDKQQPKTFKPMIDDNARVLIEYALASIEKSFSLLLGEH